MTPASSPPELLVLHAVRLTGMARSDAVAARYGLDAALAEELLLDLQACGQVTWAQFAGTGGWFLTDTGRRADERLLADELRAAGGEQAVRSVHERFLPLNGRLQQACTDWQLRPTAADPLAVNEHDDEAWDRAVLDELAELDRGLALLAGELAGVLARFDGYDRRFAAALRQARGGAHSWVDGSDRDSCHTVWFELHEDLLSTLGLRRGEERLDGG